ncbi:hypothetical protein ACFVFI_27545 [Streptomyces sp. NPDC057705]|uniref:hypothetical protein n=1 Tax=Streptomyces sp. NPDC057705 TaxID=3346222 RepID=UPI00367B1AC1
MTEGKAAGRTASVRLREDGSSFLGDGDPTLPAGEITYVKSSGKLWYGFTTFLGIAVAADPSNPIPRGKYDLEIPDEVHPLGGPYESISVYAKSWFRIGHSGDRYLHTGTHSAGCATVMDVAKWTDIYLYLIRRRKGDGMSVGTLNVFDNEVQRFANYFIPFNPFRR